MSQLAAILVIVLAGHCGWSELQSIRMCGAQMLEQRPTRPRWAVVSGGVVIYFPTAVTVVAAMYAATVLWGAD